jgi:hypothetical protein
MLIRKDIDAPRALYEEAVAMHDAAKAEFDAIETLIRDRNRTSRLATGAELLEAQRARAKLFLARVRLSRREPPR